MGKWIMEYKNPFLNDFRNFLFLVWTEALGLPPPEEIQYNIAYELQHGWNISSDGITRMQLQAARGFGKTYILCAWAVWRLLRNPDIKILMISMNANRAKESVRLVRQIIDSLEVLAPLIPKEGQRDGADRFDIGNVSRHAKDPSLAAYGVGSAVAGTHPDIIIADDTETKENSRTASTKRHLLEAYYEFENMIQPKGTIVHMGTPQSGDSVYNKLRRDYHLKRWPCRFPNITDNRACEYVADWIVEKVRDGDVAPGDPTYPSRFSEEALQEKLAIMGPYWYALQMMLDTSLADEDKYPLKTRDLIVMSCPIDKAPTNVVWGTTEVIYHIRSEGFGEDGFYGPIYFEKNFENYQKSVMWVDPSGGGDKVGYAVVKGLNGILYVLAVGGLAGGHSTATLEKLAKIAFQYSVRHVLVETNFGDGLYEKALAPIMSRINGPTHIESKRAQTSKEMRICDTLEPIVCAHRMVIDPSVAKNSDLMYQFTHISRDRGCLDSDDELDALAGAAGEFVDMMGMDPAKQEFKRKKAELEQMAKEFAEGYYRSNGRYGIPGQSSQTLPIRRATHWGAKSRWRKI